MNAPQGVMLVPLQPAEGGGLFFSLVVPTYNERDNMPELVKQITEVLDRAAPDDYELIIVDDNSPDGTSEVVNSLCPQYPRLRLLVRTEEKGLATAVVRGWQVSRGEVLGVIDGDLQHPPAVLEKMLVEARKGKDMVAASRHIAQGSVAGGLTQIRKFMSRGAQFLGLVMLPEVISKVSDPMSGFFMVRRSAIANKRLNPTGYKILVEVLSRGQIDSIAEVPYSFQPRLHGETKVRIQQFFEYIAQLIKLRIFRSSGKP